MRQGGIAQSLNRINRSIAQSHQLHQSLNRSIASIAQSHQSLNRSIAHKHHLTLHGSEFILTG